MKFVVRIGGEENTVVINEDNGYYDIDINGTHHHVDCHYFGDKDFLSLLIDNESYLIESAAVKPEEGRYYARVMGRHYDVEVFDELLAAVREAEIDEENTGENMILSPMPGLVVDILVEVGDKVEAGAPVIIVEAMKMQNKLATEAGGIVKKIFVKPKDTVDSQTQLVLIESE